MTTIVPAVLPVDFEDLAGHLERVVGLAPEVQIDVVDGVFASTTTWPYRDRDSFEHILSEEEGLPHWDEFEFEVDIMAHAATEAALEWVRAGASRVVVHAESPDHKAALEALQTFREGEAAIAVAIAIGLDTPIDALESLAHFADGIQVMGIAHVGKQGEPFDARALMRVREVRDRFPSHAISVDGGVTPTTALALAQAGATRLVSGSAIFEGDARENYRQLREQVASHTP